MRPRLRHTAALAAIVWICGCSDVEPYVREPHAAAPAPARVEGDHRLLLIGDAGDGDDSLLGDVHYPHPVLELVGDLIRALPERTTVAFLGDLIYEHGYPAHGTEDEKRHAARRFEWQLVIAGDADAVFVPGNHDWANGHEEGWDNIRALGDLLADKPGGRLAPDGGCPGPTLVPLGEHATMIALDTQWWLHEYAKPKPGANPTGCAATSEDEILAGLRDALAKVKGQGRQAVIAAHHPLRTHGAHGGFFDWRAHLFPITMAVHWAYFPFPGIGSLVVTWRSERSWMEQDLSHPAYAHMRERIGSELRSAAAEGIAPLAYAAGHDHNLQVLRDDDTGIHHLVSGQASYYRVMHVTHGEDTLFSHARSDRPGLMEMRFLPDGRVHLAVLEVNEAVTALEPVYGSWLDTGAPGAR